MLGLRSPSYLAISKDKQFLYVAEEGLEQLSLQVFAYGVGDNGKLSLLKTQRLEGAYACHLAVVGRQLIVANYGTGNAMVYPILKDGSLAHVNQIIQHTGSGCDLIRQGEPHIHMVCPINDKKLFLVDLGLDKAVNYQVDENGFWNPCPINDIVLLPGEGARHMV